MFCIINVLMSAAASGDMGEVSGLSPNPQFIYLFYYIFF